MISTNPGISQASLQETEAKKEAELAKQMESALEGEEDEEQRLIEERRRRRQQILAKHHQDKELSGEPCPASSHMRGLPCLAHLVYFLMARDSGMRDVIR